MTSAAVAPDAPIAAAPTDSIRARAGRFWTWLLVWNCTERPWLVPLIQPVFLWFAWVCSPYTRLSTLANARRILGDQATPAECRRVAKASLVNFFCFITDMGRRRRHSIQQILAGVSRVEGLETYQAARASKRGAILAAAHMGPFETAVAGLRQHEEKVHVVFQRDRKKQAFEALRHELHTQLGLIEAPVDDSPDAMGPWMGLRDALRRDEVVLLQADRTMPGQRGVRVPFFSGHVELPPGPIKLALASGSPIIPVFSYWEQDRRTRIVFERPIEVAQPWTRDSVHPSLQELARVLEKHIGQHPEQWLMFDPAFCEDREAR